MATILQTSENTELKSDVITDLRQVDTMIKSRLDSDIDLINKLSLHIFESGGKRIRPLLVLLSARAAGYTGRDHVTLAVILELIHTATLLHDDVIDESKLRRGQDTANSIWGNEASVLVGDFLYSKAFQIMVELGNSRVLGILAEATNTLAEVLPIQIGGGATVSVLDDNAKETEMIGKVLRLVGIVDQA